MKREAAIHSKTGRLARALGIKKYAAVGILESLWHLTAREAPAGDIGKLSNQDIAGEIDWDGDADRLIISLVDCRWLDKSSEHRLLIHDWSEHADDGVNTKLARAFRYFADGRRPKISKLPTKERERINAEYERMAEEEERRTSHKSAFSAHESSQPSQALPEPSLASPRMRVAAQVAAEETEPQPVAFSARAGSCQVISMPVASVGRLETQGALAVNGNAVTVGRSVPAPSPPVLSASADRELWVEGRRLMHPKKGDIEATRATLRWFYDTYPERRPALERHHDAMCKSEEWLKERSRYCPPLIAYIRDEKYYEPLPEDANASKFCGVEVPEF